MTLDSVGFNKNKNCGNYSNRNRAGLELARGEDHLYYCLTIVFGLSQDLGERKQWGCEMRFNNSHLSFGLHNSNVTVGYGVRAGCKLLG